MFYFSSLSQKLVLIILVASTVFSFASVPASAGGYEYYSDYTPSYCKDITTTAIFYILQPASLINCRNQYVYQQACDLYSFYPTNCNPNQTNCVQNNNFYSNNTCVVANNYCDASYYSGRVDDVGVEKNLSSGTVNLNVLGSISTSCNQSSLVPLFVKVTDKSGNIVVNEAQNISMFQNCPSNSRSCQNFRLSVSMNYSQFVNNTFVVSVGFLPNTSIPAYNNVVVGDYQKVNTANYGYKNTNYNTDFYPYIDSPLQYLPTYDDFPIVPFYTPANNSNYYYNDSCLVNTNDYYGACPIIY